MFKGTKYTFIFYISVQKKTIIYLIFVVNQRCNFLVFVFFKAWLVQRREVFLFFLILPI